MRYIYEIFALTGWAVTAVTVVAYGGYRLLRARVRGADRSGDTSP